MSKLVKTVLTNANLKPMSTHQETIIVNPGANTEASRPNIVRHQYKNTMTAKEYRQNLRETLKPWSAPLFFECLEKLGLPLPQDEYEFSDERKWRADFCWPEEKVILEVEGGAYVRGRHTRGKGFEKDIEKYLTAQAMGYRVLRCQPKDFPGKYSKTISALVVDALSSALGVEV